MLKIGRWYHWTGQPSRLAGRPVRIQGDEGNGLYKGRWANGLEVTVFESNIGEPLSGEPPMPGVTEPCLICKGGMLPVHEATAEPWVSVVVGARPCPNCRVLD